MFQEMIDSDIKAEFDDVMTSNQLGFSNVDSLDLLNNLDDLDTPFKFDSRYHGVDEVLNHPPQWNQPTSQDIAALNSAYFEDSLGGNVMVNPNSVMPVHQQFHSQQGPPSHTPSPVPPPGPQQQHLTVNTQQQQHQQQQHQQQQQQPQPQQQYHHNLQSPSNTNPHSPHTYSTTPHLTPHYQYHPAQTTGQLNMVGKTLKVLPPVSSPMQQVGSLRSPDPRLVLTESIFRFPARDLSLQTLSQLTGRNRPASTKNPACPNLHIHTVVLLP